MDAAVARSYGMLAHIAVTGGRQVRRSVMDLLIAATAHAHAVPLYTRDAHDFAVVESEVEIQVV